MKKFLLLLIFTISWTAFASAQSIKGVLYSKKDNIPIEGAHILNTSQNKMAISSASGVFKLEAKAGDTIVVSNINFNTKQLIVSDEQEVEIWLNPAEIQLKEVVVSNMPPTQSAFRKQLVDMPMQDDGKLVPFGVTPGKPMGKIPKLYERETKLKFGGSAAGPGIGLPVSFFTKKFSKRHKSMRKYYETVANQRHTIANAQKYNREIVTYLTGLKGDALTDFMNSLDLDEAYITTATEYEIAALIVKKFKNYAD